MKQYCRGRPDIGRCDHCQMKDNWKTLKQMPHELAKVIKDDMHPIETESCVDHHFRYFMLMPL